MKKIIPHFIAILTFVVISCVYFQPVFDGKEIKQGDITNFRGMSKEIWDFREKFHQEPLWTNSMFGGMPAFQISVLHNGNLMQYVHRALSLGLPHPVNLVFLYLLGFYILLIVLGIDPWLGVVGAIAFAFSSYFFIIIEAGHNSKALAIAYIPPTIAGFILIFQRKYLLGGVLAALFLALDLYANHPQITYYMFLFLAIYVFIETINAIKGKEYVHLGKAIAVMGVASLLAVGSDAGNLLSTYQYGKFSTRGKSELTTNKENKTSGLDKDYATQWSYGQWETMSLLIPDFKGGSSGAIGNTHKDALNNVDSQFKEYIGKSDQYWGDQPFTSGPVYAGAIIVFLFVLGLFIVEGPLKLSLAVATLFSIMLAWGKNMMFLSEFFLDHFPGYNKFRAVSMILVIAEFAIPLLAVLALDKFIKNRQNLEAKIKVPFLKEPTSNKIVFFVSFALTGGLALLYYLLPGFTTFFKANESEQIFAQITKGGNPPQVAQTFLDNLQLARQSILKADAIRTFGLILLSAGLLWMYFKTTIERKYIALTLAFFVLVDLWNVDRRYLNGDNFSPKSKVQSPFQPSTADNIILADKDPDYRVLNIGVSTFNDASTSYFHKSIGGYHGAKMKRYQELVDFQIDKNIQSIENALRNNPTDSSIQQAFARQGVLNMLNTRYLIYNPEAAPLVNRSAYGNAWFVKQTKVVENADSAIVAVGEVNTLHTAVVEKQDAAMLDGFKFHEEPASTIPLKSYQANELKYEATSNAEQLAVFSEIYYKDGWNAYVDGKIIPHFRANFVLRAMRVPAGKHEIIFKFEPKVFALGENISLACSALLLVIVFGVGFREGKTYFGVKATA